jgi:hypothetical protein
MKPILRYLVIILILTFFFTIYLQTLKNEEIESNEDNLVSEYLALGDSYTIGESVDPKQRWPTQLLYILKSSEVDLV